MKKNKVKKSDDVAYFMYVGEHNRGEVESYESLDHVTETIYELFECGVKSSEIYVYEGRRITLDL